YVRCLREHSTRVHFKFASAPLNGLSNFTFSADFPILLLARRGFGGSRTNMLQQISVIRLLLSCVVSLTYQPHRVIQRCRSQKTPACQRSKALQRPTVHWRSTFGDGLPNYHSSFVREHRNV